MVSWMEYKDCGLKGAEQVYSNEIDKKKVNMISKMNKKIKQTNEIKLKNIPNSNKYPEFAYHQESAKMYSVVGIGQCC
ncbi:hypothetical protein F8M41_005117 [Gigaspora margarita]|uniref:Uncharacterized protein n=1 Tax=Gigaspora margarita TaxID=4874 RepID=A0A8H4AXM5_GIGMA|nr:hypothetical protein F8M41_005117 [Gigaspora margarita]